MMASRHLKRKLGIGKAICESIQFSRKGRKGNCIKAAKPSRIAFCGLLRIPLCGLCVKCVCNAVFARE